LDSFNVPYASAVGPTQQPTQASGVPAYAQLFYLKSTGTGGIMDTVTVTLTGPAGTVVPAFGMVMAEYSGLDTVVPLDSVSEAVSNSGSPSGTLDSGTASPANANLLIFGGGNIDNSNAPNAFGSGFTGIQSNNATNNSSATEYQVVSSNNALWRATAAYSPSGPTGDWLMQMAVFRGASWTVAQGASPTRTHGVLYADQFPGTDIGAQINNAYASCPHNGCIIDVSPGTYSFSNPILFGLATGGNSGTAVVLRCHGSANGLTGTVGSTELIYTGTGSTVAISFSDGGFTGSGMQGCTLIGPSKTGSTVGLSCAPTSGLNGFTADGVCVGHYFEGNDISGFGVGIQMGGASSGGFLNTFFVNTIHDNGKNLYLTNEGTQAPGNEENKFIGGLFSEQALPSSTCIDTSGSTTAYDIEFIGVSLDQCPVNMNGAGMRFRFIGSHLELNKQYASLTPFITLTSCSTCNLQLDATDIVEDLFASGRTGFIVNNNTSTPATVIINGGRFLSTTSGSTSIPIVHDAGGGNLTSIQNTYKSGTVKTDVDSGLSYATFEYGNLTIGGSQDATLSFGSGLIVTAANPMATAGFGGGSVTANSNGTQAFTVKVGTASATGVLTMPAGAVTGWNCSCVDISTVNSTVFQCRATAALVNTVGVGNYNTSGASANWAANDILELSCFPR
jgi:hypothetical protein